MNLTIIGVAGYAGAGKDTFAKVLKEQFEQRGRSVTMISSGDLIRQYVRDNKLGDVGDRPLLRKVVDDVAKDHGYTYWLEESIKAAAQSDILIYPGLRQAVEVDKIHNEHGYAIAIDVPVETRYQWAQLRARPGDDIDFETFKKNEEAERAGSAQQIDTVMNRADVRVSNDGTLEQLTAVAAKIAEIYPERPAAMYHASEL